MYKFKSRAPDGCTIMCVTFLSLDVITELKQVVRYLFISFESHLRTYSAVKDSCVKTAT